MLVFRMVFLSLLDKEDSGKGGECMDLTETLFQHSKRSMC